MVTGRFLNATKCGWLVTDFTRRAGWVMNRERSKV